MSVLGQVVGFWVTSRKVSPTATGGRRVRLGTETVEGQRVGPGRPRREHEVHSGLEWTSS